MTEKTRRKRVRENVRGRFLKSSRFWVASVLTLLAALILINGIIIYLQSPRRRKYHFYQDGLAAYGRSDFDTARIHFRRYLELEPDSADAHYMLGLCHFQAGEVTDAVRKLEEAVALQPGFDLAHVTLAEHHRKRGDMRAAATSAMAAIETDPVPASAWRVLAEVRAALGDSEGAVQAFRRALEIEPDHIESILKLGDLYLAQKYVGIGDVREGLARSRYERALDLAEIRRRNRPGDVKFLLYAAQAHGGLGSAREAVRLVETVIESQPEKADHRILYARLLAADGKPEKADEALAAASVDTPRPDVDIEWAGVVDRELDDKNRAIGILADAMKVFPDSPELRIAHVGLLHEAGLLDEAAAAMGQARVKFPTNAAIVAAEGDLHALAGRVDEAVAAFRAAVELNPQNLSARRKLIDYLLPEVLKTAESGDPEPAGREELLAHLSFFLDPTNGINTRDLRARGAMARLMFAEGKLDKVTELLSNSTGITTKNWIGLKILGVASLRSGEYDRAAEALSDALNHKDCPGTKSDYELAYMASYRSLNPAREAEIAERAVAEWPEDPEWRLRLARSYVRSGRPGLALRECGEARQLLEGSRDVRAHLLLARVHQNRGETGQARAALEEAVAIRRDAETRGALYAFFAATGDETLAKKGFRTLIEETPDDPEAFLAFGDFLSRQGDPAAAAVQYEKVLELDPESVGAVERLAELRIANAKTEEDAIAAARDVVSKLAEIAPDSPRIAYFRGKLHLLRGEPEKALPYLVRYARENPDDSAGAYYLAIAFRRTGDLEKARAYFVSAIGMNQDLVEAKLELATLYFTQGLRAHGRGDMKEARAAFEQVAEFDPNQLETRRFLADTLAQLGLLDLAAGEAERVLKLHPDEPGAVFLVALHRAKQGKWDLALDGFKQLAGLAPDNYRSHLYLGMAYGELRQFDAARESLRAAWQRSPGARDVLHAIATTELVAGEVAEAIRFVEAQRDERARDPFLHQLLGDLYREAGRTEDAIAAYRHAFELSPKYEVALGMAAALMADGGELDRAIEILREGETRSEAPAGLKTLRGRMLFRVGRIKDAELAWREALDLDPKYLAAARELGLLCLDSDRQSEGESLLRRALTAKPNDPAAWFRLAHSAARDGRLDVAAKAYGLVLKLVPGDPATLNNLALVLSRTEDRRAEAIDLARKAVESRPDDARLADTLGWVLYRADRFEEAAKILKAAATKLATDAEAWFHAGMASKETFEWDDARKMLKKALELDEDFEGADQARAALKEIG